MSPFALNGSGTSFAVAGIVNLAGLPLNLQFGLTYLFALQSSESFNDGQCLAVARENSMEIKSAREECSTAEATEGNSQGDTKAHRSRQPNAQSGACINSPTSQNERKNTAHCGSSSRSPGSSVSSGSVAPNRPAVMSITGMTIVLDTINWTDISNYSSKIESFECYVESVLQPPQSPVVKSRRILPIFPSPLHFTASRP